MRKPTHFEHILVGMGGPLVIGLFLVVLDFMKPQALAQKVPALPPGLPPGISMPSVPGTSGIPGGPPVLGSHGFPVMPGNPGAPAAPATPMMPPMPGSLGGSAMPGMAVMPSPPVVPALPSPQLPKPTVVPAEIKTGEPPLGGPPKLPKGSVDLLAGIIEDYFYTSVGKRDPFLPLESAGNLTSIAGPNFPLENFDLSQLKLVGVIWDVRAPKAMLLDPSGKGYIVKVGDRVGRHKGHVKKIRESEIIVVENDEGMDGRITHQNKALRLQTE